jgi:hypothetical protein
MPDPSPKSYIDTTDLSVIDMDQLGRSYYIFCLEQALANITQARMLVAGDVTETNHELPLIQQLITEALDAS